VKRTFTKSEQFLERSLKSIPLSAPFDATAVDFLESLEVPCHKIASFENTDLPLLEKVAQTGKPVIMSTGMATVAELDESVRTLRENGCKAAWSHPAKIGLDLHKRY